MAWVTGRPDGDPLTPNGPCDPLAGAHAAFATLLALWDRRSSGIGRHVEVPMVDVALNVTAEQVAEHQAAGTLVGRDGNRGPDAAPQGVYPCAGDEAWVAISVATDEQWAALAGLIGSSAWSADGRLATVTGRRLAHDDLDRGLATWTAGQDAEVLAETLAAAGIPAGIVVRSCDVVHNPQLIARGFFEHVEHDVVGPHPVPSLPFRLSGVERWNRFAAPTLGQHNREIFACTSTT